MARLAPSTQTGDVLLRDVTEGDLPIFFEHKGDPEANSFARERPWPLAGLYADPGRDGRTSSNRPGA